MNFFPKIVRVFHKPIPESFHTRKFHVSLVKCTENQKTDKASDEVIDILSELQEPKISEEEILKKQFKSRLSERVYRKFVKKEALPIENKLDFQDYRLRAYYGRNGSASNLNPGICWPTRDEILETMEYDKTLEPSLQERLKNVETERLAKESIKKRYEAEVDSNMEKLDKSLADYHARIEKKKADALALKLKREKLVEEISEYLGYDIDPKDPRFQEAVEQREKEKKKSLKVKKQQESYEKMIAKLQEMAQK